jgi:hypothetical protein
LGHSNKCPTCLGGIGVTRMGRGTELFTDVLPAGSRERSEIQRGSWQSRRSRHRRSVRAVAALTLGGGLLPLTSCASEPDRTGPSPASSASASRSPGNPLVYAAQLLKETNDVRALHGLPRLVGSACAQRAALERVSNLIGVPKLTHASLTGVVGDCAPATTAAENLSRAVASPSAVMGAWMGSPGHRSNILDPGLTEIGVGCVPDGHAMLCSQVYLGQ